MPKSHVIDTCPLIYLDLLSFFLVDLKVKESVGNSANISIFCDSELGGLLRNPGGVSLL